MHDALRPGAKYDSVLHAKTHYCATVKVTPWKYWHSGNWSICQQSCLSKAKVSLMAASTLSFHSLCHTQFPCLLARCERCWHDGHQYEAIAGGPVALCINENRSIINWILCVSPAFHLLYHSRSSWIRGLLQHKKSSKLHPNFHRQTNISAPPCALVCEMHHSV